MRGTSSLVAVAVVLALGAAVSACEGTSGPATAPPAGPPPTRPLPPPVPPAAPPPAPPPPTTPAPVLAGQIPNRLPTSRRVVALTFDAGAGDGGVPSILATLRETGVTATFFMTGRFAELFPSLARLIASRYPIGNHTFDHPDLLTLSPRAATDEIVMGEQTIERVTGRAPVRLFRFPYGSSDADALRLVNQLGYTAVGWTADTLGWEGTTGGQTRRSVVAHVLAELQPGEIVVLHVGANPTDRSTLDADALRTIIDDVQARGYGFVDLADLLRP